MANKENTIKLSPEIKKKVCKAVEGHVIIWNKIEKAHSNRNAMQKAWKLVSNEVGISEQLCRKAWRSVVDRKRYRSRKTMKSGSACDIDLEVDEEFLENSSEPWELEEDIQFLEESSNKRITDSTDVFENISSITHSQGPSSSYSYKDNSASTSTKKKRYLEDLADTGNQLALSMTKIVELAEKGESAHAGFLGHLSSIMSNDEFQGRVMNLAYEMLANRK